jgi:hypothetical protein
MRILIIDAFIVLWHCHLDGYNVQPEVLLLPAKLGLLSGPGSNTFSLENIRLYVLRFVSTFSRFVSSVLSEFSRNFLLI